MARIFPIRLFEDNYAYLVCSPFSGRSCLIDPADVNKVLDFLSNFKNLTINHILYTHKHWDHASGSKNLFNILNEKYPYSKPVFIAHKHELDTIEHVDIPLEENGAFDSGDFIVKHYHVPCHTLGHVLYRFKIATLESDFKTEFPDNIDFYFESDDFMFTGDTIFIGGCGRFFEGNAEQMLKNMDLVAGLDENLHIFPGHEYTLKNLKWAISVDKNNSYISQKIDELSKMKDVISIPSTVKQEKQMNLFMKCHEKYLQDIIGIHSPVKLMNKLRELKNENKGI